jgi:hypothetical protein
LTSFIQKYTVKKVLQFYNSFHAILLILPWGRDKNMQGWALTACVRMDVGTDVGAQTREPLQPLKMSSDFCVASTTIKVAHPCPMMYPYDVIIILLLNSN